MKIRRTQNAARNILFDGSLKLVNMIVPFFMRSLMLYYLGVEYLGLNGLFRSVFSFLNMAEMGVGSAMVFSMYRPVAEDDRETICALMKLYRTLYRIIGLAVAGLGLALTPFLRKLIMGDFPVDLNLYILYFMNLASTVLSYWLFAYKHSLLYACQRKDVDSKVKLGCQIAEYALKISALTVFHNYYMYLGAQLLMQIAANLATARQVDRLFPGFCARGELPAEKVKNIARRVRDLFTARFAGTIFNSADTLVISSFLGLAALAVYQNYFYIISALKTFVDVIVNACIAGVGNSLVTESKEKNVRDFTRFTMLFGWVMCVASAMLLCLYHPFMRLWMGEDSLLPFHYAVCFAVYFYIIGISKGMNMFKDAAGIWHRDRFRPLAAALVNLGLNLGTVKWLGLYGVLLSSVAAVTVVELPWLLHNLFQEVFPRKSMRGFVRSFLGLVTAAAAGCAAAWFLCGLFSLSLWATLIVNGAISFLVPNVFFLLLYGRNPLVVQSVKQIKRLALEQKKAL